MLVEMFWGADFFDGTVTVTNSRG
ncbi:hypothetical protein A2U01_0060869, partial [Trifolium medium]|nr:hypothetical protein [Trifolium medium]